MKHYFTITILKIIQKSFVFFVNTNLLLKLLQKLFLSLEPAYSTFLYEFNHSYLSIHIYHSIYLITFAHFPTKNRGVIKYLISKNLIFK